MLTVAMVCLGNSNALAQANMPTDSASTETATESIWEIAQAGGLIGYLIIALSIVAVALVFEQMFNLREKVIMPEGLSELVRQQLLSGRLRQADESCREKASVLSYILHAGLGEADIGWVAVEKAAEDATAEQSARLFRKIEYLSVIANICTMLGLLGTVVGLIIAFRELAGSGGLAKPAQLARGIYQALVTTVEGLIVAIPSMAAFAVLRNRLDQIMAESALAAQRALAPLKRLRVSRRGAREQEQATPGPLPATRSTGKDPSTTPSRTTEGDG